MERPEAARAKEQRWLHKGKVAFEGFLLLLVPQVVGGWGQPSSSTAGSQHPQTRAISSIRRKTPTGRIMELFRLEKPWKIIQPSCYQTSGPSGICHWHWESSCRRWMPQTLPAPPQHPAQTYSPMPPPPVCLQQSLPWQPAWPQQLPTCPAKSCCSPQDLSSTITGLTCCQAPSPSTFSCLGLLA